MPGQKDRYWHTGHGNIGQTRLCYFEGNKLTNKNLIFAFFIESNFFLVWKFIFYRLLNFSYYIFFRGKIALEINVVLTNSSRKFFWRKLHWVSRGNATRANGMENKIEIIKHWIMASQGLHSKSQNYFSTNFKHSILTHVFPSLELTS